jgi:hypothetical protein
MQAKHNHLADFFIQEQTKARPGRLCLDVCAHNTTKWPVKQYNDMTLCIPISVKEIRSKEERDRSGSGVWTGRSPIGPSPGLHPRKSKLSSQHPIQCKEINRIPCK